MKQIVVSITIAAEICAQTPPRPQVPANIEAPPGENVALVAHASGVQIYICQQGPESKYSWTLKAPEAELRNNEGTLIGQHYAGPAWTHKDGSSVTGRPTARADSPGRNSIPWLLLNATGHEGNGVLSSVTHIQRIHTKAGEPPAAADCNASKQGSEARSSYTADYYFYAPGK